MTTYIAFMRAINVAGHAIIKMEDLRAAFAAAGCRNVRTFIQSGNVIFECAKERSEVIFQKVGVKVRDLLNAEPSILFRTLHEVEGIVKAEPFKDINAGTEIKFCVAFLFQKPRTKPRLPVASSKEFVEAIAMKDLDVFILSRRKPNGFFGFPSNFIEKELGVSATSRNWSTVTKIVEFARRVV